MKQIKTIRHPSLPSARRMTPLEMNSVRLGRKHTVLTPDLLEKMSGNQKS